MGSAPTGSTVAVTPSDSGTSGAVPTTVSPTWTPASGAVPTDTSTPTDWPPAVPPTLAAMTGSSLPPPPPPGSGRGSGESAPASGVDFFVGAGLVAATAAGAEPNVAGAASFERGSSRALCAV